MRREFQEVVDEEDGEVQSVDLNISNTGVGSSYRLDDIEERKDVVWTEEQKEEIERKKEMIRETRTDKQKLWEH